MKSLLSRRLALSSDLIFIETKKKCKRKQVIVIFELLIKELLHFFPILNSINGTGHVDMFFVPGSCCHPPPARTSTTNKEY